MTDREKRILLTSTKVGNCHLTTRNHWNSLYFESTSMNLPTNCISFPNLLAIFDDNYPSLKVPYPSKEGIVLYHVTKGEFKLF